MSRTEGTSDTKQLIEEIEELLKSYADAYAEGMDHERGSDFASSMNNELSILLAHVKELTQQRDDALAAEALLRDRVEKLEAVRQAVMKLVDDGAFSFESWGDVEFRPLGKAMNALKRKK